MQQLEEEEAAAAVAVWVAGDLDDDDEFTDDEEQDEEAARVHDAAEEAQLAVQTMKAEMAEIVILAQSLHAEHPEEGATAVAQQDLFERQLQHQRQQQVAAEREIGELSAKLTAAEERQQRQKEIQEQQQRVAAEQEEQQRATEQQPRLLKAATAAAEASKHRAAAAEKEQKCVALQRMHEDQEEQREASVRASAEAAKLVAAAKLEAGRTVAAAEKKAAEARLAVEVVKDEAEAVLAQTQTLHVEHSEPIDAHSADASMMASSRLQVAISTPTSLPSPSLSFSALRLSSCLFLGNPLWILVCSVSLLRRQRKNAPQRS